MKKPTYEEFGEAWFAAFEKCPRKDWPPIVAGFDTTWRKVAEEVAYGTERGRRIYGIVTASPWTYEYLLSAMSEGWYIEVKDSTRTWERVLVTPAGRFGISDHQEKFSASHAALWEVEVTA